MECAGALPRHARPQRVDRVVHFSRRSAPPRPVLSLPVLILLVIGHERTRCPRLPFSRLESDFFTISFLFLVLCSADFCDPFACPQVSTSGSWGDRSRDWRLAGPCAWSSSEICPTLLWPRQMLEGVASRGGWVSFSALSGSGRSSPWPTDHVLRA